MDSRPSETRPSADEAEAGDATVRSGPRQLPRAQVPASQRPAAEPDPTVTAQPGIYSGSKPGLENVPGLEEAQTVITDSKGLELPRQPGGGGTPMEIARVLLGHQLEHFQLESLIGGGGMGAVFRARDLRLDRTVAIKVIPRVGDDPELQRRFRNEAQSAARLDHPNIARVYDVGQHEGWHYIVFEYIEGTNLRDLVARDGLLDVDDAIYYTRQVAEALDHAHRRGVTHRDIKPSNVLVTPEGLVKLVDMGLARAQQLEMSEDMTASGVTLGTFDYISPEQAHDPRDADVRSDIYSLGCTLYFALTGSPPYPSGTVLQKLLSHGSSPPPDPRMIRSGLSENLVAVLHKMLAKQPGDRYRKPVDLISDLYLLAERENLPRALSAGSIAIAPNYRFLSLLERHLPWVVAAILLVAVTAWLQLLSSAGGDLVITSPEPPPRIVQTSERAADRAAPGSAQGASAGESGAGAVPVPPIDPANNPAGETPRTTDSTAPSRGGEAVDDAAPPYFRGITDSVREGWRKAAGGAAAAAADSSSPILSPRAIRVIGPGEEEAGTIDSNNRLLVMTLEEALEAAKANTDVTVIELSAPVIRSGPVSLPRRGLTIRGTGRSHVLSFAPHTPSTTRRAAMFDLGPYSVDFENLHFVYSLPRAAIDGGTLFSLQGNNTVRFNRCSITIENSLKRAAVYAFETELDRAATPNDIGAGESSAPLEVGSPPLPLVAIKLTDSIVRGQMSMLALDAPALLQLQWDNGLLAVSRRMIEAVGGSRSTAAGLGRMTLRLNEVTAAATEGLVAIRLAASGHQPLLVERTAQRCVFTFGTDAPLIEMTGLDDVTAVDRYVILRGNDNYYDASDGHSAPIVRATSSDQGMLVYGVSELLTADRPSWIHEESPQPMVRWADPVPPDSPAHLRTAAEYLQEGVVFSGFDPDRLPATPRGIAPPSE